MSEKAVHLPAINCQHCLNTIRRELSELEGVSEVSGDLEHKQVSIRFSEPASWDSIRQLLIEIGFPPEA
jgi:copper chaperone